MPVILQCHCDGTNGSTVFTDVSTIATTLTPTNCTVTTTSPKFGTGSADFTAGAAARIDTGNAAAFRLGAGQFTIEAWAYFTSSPGSTLNGVVTQWGSAPNLGWFFGMVLGNLAFYYSTTGSDNPNVGAAYTPTLNTWIHLAVDRDASNVLRVYANGVVVASATVSATIFASNYTGIIGNDHGFTYAVFGHLDEVRVTTGLAQYGGAFTPPTAPFSDPAYIPLLNATWNPADRTASITLTDRNLTASMGGSNQGVRATNSQSTGKFYFEIKATVWAFSAASLGIANAAASLGGLSSDATAAAIIYQSTGVVWVNNGGTSVNLGSRSDGDTIGIALDLTNKLIWFRVAPVGNWNGNAGFSPGGTGGVNITSITGTPVMPIVSAQSAAGCIFTAGFGDSAFVGAVPAGFTSGFPGASAGGGATAQARALIMA